LNRARLRPGVGLAILLFAAAAEAAPIDEIVGAVAGTGGFNARVVPANAASVYFNPAFLPDVPAGLELGAFVLSDQVGIHLLGRPGRAADLPEGTIDMERPGGGRYPEAGLPTRWLEEGRPASPPDEPLAPRPRQAAGSSQKVRVYQVLGLVQKLAGGRVGVGVAALLPYGKFTNARAFYNDEREQYFSNSLHPELLSDRLTITSLAFGAGVRLHPRLSLGASLTLGLRTIAQTPTYVNDIGRFQAIKVDSDVGVVAAFAPHFGAVLRTSERTHLAATVHTPQKIEIETDFSFLLPSGIEQRAALSFTHGYVPWIFALGGSARLYGTAGDELVAVATLEHARWSDYRDRHSERPDPAYAWSNPISASAGLRKQAGGTTVALDARFVPTPVPSQTGRSNYVDNDRLAALFACEHRATLSWGTLRAGLSAQAHRLLPREVAKTATGAAQVIDEVPDDAVVAGMPLPGREGLQTNNPGWPGFASRGWIWGTGAYVAAGF
jgi:long-chain fatty acid transport protein